MITFEHAGSACDDDVSVDIFSDVRVALENGLEGEFMHSEQFFSDNFGGLEEGFRTLEDLAS